MGKYHLSGLRVINRIKIIFFPDSAKKIKCNNVKIISYQKASQVLDLSIDEITLNHNLNDAFLVSGLHPEISFIFYNEDSNKSRIKHSLLHEIGHIKCGHKKHGDQEEVEAHFFASQANAPNAIIKAIHDRGYQIDVPLLIKCFGLSRESATKKMGYFGRFGFEHPNDLDLLILRQFSTYIDSNFPFKGRRQEDKYFADLEQERESWY